MKKQLLFIPLIIALTALGGWKILRLKAVAPAGEHSEHEGEEGGHHEHEEGGHEGEHGDEGHVELSPEARKNANLTIEEAGPATIQTLLPLYGKIAANEETMAHVQPRFPGIVKEVRKRLGDKVEKGEVLARIESNESLQTYDVKAEIAGTIIAKDVTLGESTTNEDTLFVISDLSTVWVDLSVFRKDFSLLKPGAPVFIRDEDEVIKAKLDYISPFGAENTQTALARCVISNPGHLRPGLFITAEIATGEVEAFVAVKVAAIQTLEEKTVVFVEEGDGLEARPVELGAKDATHVEVISGVLPGDKYVSENSFILKAEIGKSEAEHEH